jgi:EmrB/QacA subfamily drug resistance transporter
MGSLRVRLARTPPGYRFSVGRVLAIYAGLMVALLLAAVDLTVVVTALPRIVSELGGISSYPWVFTAYTLASTVTVPLYGKLGDIYGRRPLFMAAIAIFLVGTVLCGAAQSMVQLIVFRAVQGLGAGGLFSVAMATVGEIVPARDRGRYHGLFGATFAFASIAGPPLGGFIVDNLSWRWIFFVNVPVGLFALVVASLTMPAPVTRREHSVDYLGAALLTAGTTGFMLGVVWGGRDYPWLSPEVLGALGAGVAFLIAFAFVERRVREPILPFDLLRRPSVASGVLAIAFAAMAMFGTITYVPLFVQGVIGSSATSSGVVLTPLMLGAVTMSILSGQWVSRTGRYRANALAGPVILFAGLLMLSRMDVSTTVGEAARNMILAGVGMGLMMQIFVLVVQNDSPLEAMGSATALTQFARAIGGTIGVTVMGVIVNQGLPAQARTEGPELHRLPLAARDQLAEAIRPAFFAGAAAAAAVFLIALVGIREKPLRRGVEEHPLADEVGEGAAAS